jgi:hypothetical protein
MFKMAPVILGTLAFSPPSLAVASDSSAIIRSVTVSIVAANSNGSGVIIKRAGNRSQAIKVNGIIDRIKKGGS